MTEYLVERTSLDYVWRSTAPERRLESDPMAPTCPIPTPTERRKGEILERAQRAMLDKVSSAIDEARAGVEAELRAAGLNDAAPPLRYFAATAHQQVFCRLCGADPDTFAGGNATIALASIRNCQAIARHYCGANIPT